MQFCTVINCMDGRVQLPVIEYLQKRFHVEFVDSITEPGPNLILSKQHDLNLVQSILKKVAISIFKHHSVGIAIIGHHDCAGNPTNKDEQIQHIIDSIKFIRKQHNKIEIIGLWINGNWNIQEI